MSLTWKVEMKHKELGKTPKKGAGQKERASSESSEASPWVKDTAFLGSNGCFFFVYEYKSHSPGSKRNVEGREGKSGPLLYLSIILNINY